MNPDIYEKNMAALQERYPNLYQKIKSWPETKEIEVFPSKCGLPSLRVNDILFHSAYNPWRDADCLVDNQRMQRVQQLIVLGLGLGYHVRKVWENPYFQGKMLIIEKDPGIFRKSLENIDCTYLIKDSNVILIVEDNLDQFVKLVEGCGFFSGQMIEVDTLIHPPSHQVSRDFYLEAVRVIRGLLSFSMASFATAHRFYNYWQQNSIDNLTDMASFPWIKEIEGCAKGKPALVVSAGPSLDRDKEMLKQAQGKVFIISVGTALKALLKSGIKPDMVVVVDGHEKALKQFEGFTVPPYTWLCAADFIRKEIVDMFKPRVFFYTSSRNPFSRLFVPEQVKKGKVYAGGSVAHSAIDIAVKMGFTDIILLGQDLSYLDNKTHASGTMYEKDRVIPGDEEKAKEKGFIQLKGNYQDKVLSSPSFYTFLASLERYIHLHPEIKFINCTSAGAFIRGTELMPLQKALTVYEKQGVVSSVREHFETGRAGFSPLSEELQSNVAEAISQMEGIIADLEKGYERAKEFTQALSSKEKISSQDIAPLAADLQEVGQNLGKSPYLELLLYGEGYLKILLMNIQGKMIGMDSDAQKELFRTIDEVYKALLDSARKVEEELTGIRKREDLWTKTVPTS